MIEPTKADIGRKVVYRRDLGVTGHRLEEGVITSYNDHYVFVRYDANQTSAATRREDLEWVS